MDLPGASPAVPGVRSPRPSPGRYVAQNEVGAAAERITPPCAEVSARNSSTSTWRRRSSSSGCCVDKSGLVTTASRSSNRLSPALASSVCACTASEGTCARSATEVSMTRSSNSTPSRAATLGPTTLPPAPYRATMVSTGGGTDRGGQRSAKHAPGRRVRVGPDGVGFRVTGRRAVIHPIRTTQPHPTTQRHRTACRGLGRETHQRPMSGMAVSTAVWWKPSPSAGCGGDSRDLRQQPPAH